VELHASKASWRGKRIHGLLDCDFWLFRNSGHCGKTSPFVDFAVAVLAPDESSRRLEKS
jgi:hypothetical protein